MTATLDQIEAMHDELVAKINANEMSQVEYDETMEQLCVIEVAWCSHPDRPVWTDEQVAEYFAE